MNNYYELRIKINPEMEDIISEICFENLPCEGIVLAEETYKDLEMVSTTEGTLKVFLTEECEVETFIKEQRELLKSRGFTDDELGSWEFTLDAKANEDWSKKWKEKWDVTHVTDRITVVPDWLEYTPHREDEVIIRLEPGCAFGTGTHQTTQLCMKAIEKYMPANAKVADIGTGSGILAVCAIKFGAKSAYGCDNDPTVIDVAKENAEKNGIAVYPPLEGGSKSSISGWGKKATHKYPQEHIQIAKNLRNNATDAEQLLWNYLKNSQLNGIKFRRQQPIGNYIVDFMSSSQKIIIELDGSQHNSEENIYKDNIRDEFLISQGYTVIRIWNNNIFNHIEQVLNFILDTINNPTRKLKISTLPQGEGDGRYCHFELNTADKIKEQYDFVMANILHNVLFEIMGDLKAIMKDGAYLSLSGILNEKREIVLEAIQRENLDIVEEIHQDQWTSFIVKK